jgi:hypothetical protein
MHQSVHISCMMIGIITWKNAWKSSVLFFLFLFFFLAHSRAFLLLVFSYKNGFVSFRLVLYAFCCIFHWVENFPLYKLSHPITVCSSIRISYLSYPSCPLILIIAFDTDSPLKYVSSPSCSMSHSLGSIRFRIRLICLMTFFLRLLLLTHWKMWSSSSNGCQQDAHLLS